MASVRLRKALGRLGRPGPRGVVVAISVLYVVLFSFLAIYKHEIYASSRFDLGNMDQAVWNSAHGRILEATDEQGEITSRLKNHADFLLLAFVPLYWITPSPYWLLITQSAAVGLGAIPLYWLARRFLGRDWPAALIAVAYLLNYGLQSANLFDFHAQMMAGTFLLFAFHYMLERRPFLFVLFAALASLTKEEVVLLVAMMGLYALFVEKRPRWGLPIFLAGTGYFLLIMQVVIPAFNVGDTSQLVEGRYEAFGGSMGGVVRTAITDPIFTLSFLLSGDKPLYLASLLGMTGFLALFAPFVLAIPLPEIAINLLSDRPQMANIRYHYSAPILPFVYVAAAAGIRNLLWLLRRAANLRRRPFAWLGRLAPGETVREKLPLFLALGMLLFGAQTDYEAGPLPVFSAPDNTATVIHPSPEEHLDALDEAVSLIPDGAKVSATNQIGPHLAHRRYLYLFPTVQDADYVVVDETTPAYDTYINPVLNLQTTAELRESPGYRKLYERNGVVVFERRD
ncbi:MAG: DUF2079 domain-containing protein [Actinomycetota bacterium]|nr:DUF2079 domain-containing protein [Actinomycetota bacterium]